MSTGQHKQPPVLSPTKYETLTKCQKYSVEIEFFLLSLLRPCQIVDEKVNTAVDRQEKLTEEG